MKLDKSLVQKWIKFYQKVVNREVKYNVQMGFPFPQITTTKETPGSEGMFSIGSEYISKSDRDKGVTHVWLNGKHHSTPGIYKVEQYARPQQPWKAFSPTYKEEMYENFSIFYNWDCGWKPKTKEIRKEDKNTTTYYYKVYKCGKWVDIKQQLKK